MSLSQLEIDQYIDEINKAKERECKIAVFKAWSCVYPNERCRLSLIWREQYTKHN